MGEENQVPEKKDLVADESQLPPVALNHSRNILPVRPDETGRYYNPMDDCSYITIGAR